MRWYGKEITVARCETFSLTCKITNEDGVPYMISSNLENPTFLLTVANTLYKSDDKRYVLKCWTPLVTDTTTEPPTFVNGFVFDNLVPIDVQNLDAENNTSIDTSKRYLYRLTQQWNDYIPGYYIYCNKNGTIGFHLYETIFVQNFPSYITKEWYSKNFYYELRLVSGEYTDEFKQALEDNDYSAYTDNPFDLITDEFIIIPKTQLNVLSRLGGYNNG